MSRLSLNIVDKIIANSLEIYEYEAEEFKKINNNYKCLCYHGEKTASCNINSQYPFLYKCFGCEDSGNVITFVAKSHNISYGEAIKYIENLDLNLENNTKSAIKLEKKEKLLVDWVDIPFTDNHKRYFEEYQLDEKFLNSRDIYALKTLAINKRIQKFKEGQFKFVYFAKDINEIKVLTLGNGVAKEEKWKSYNIPNTYLWDLWRYKECDNLFICKSNKDAAIFAKLGYCAIATQNESAKTMLSNIEIINKICKTPIIVYGTDKQGKEQSIEITKQTGWRWFNVPDKYFNKYQANDPAELIKIYDLNKLKRELKIKGL